MINGKLVKLELGIIHSNYLFLAVNSIALIKKLAFCDLLIAFDFNAEPRRFYMTVETSGALTPEMIFSDAIDVLASKLGALRYEVNRLLDRSSGGVAGAPATLTRNIDNGDPTGDNQARTSNSGRYDNENDSMRAAGEEFSRPSSARRRNEDGDRDRDRSRTNHRDQESGASGHGREGYRDNHGNSRSPARNDNRWSDEYGSSAHGRDEPNSGGRPPQERPAEAPVSGSSTAKAQPQDSWDEW